MANTLKLEELLASLSVVPQQRLAPTQLQIPVFKAHVMADTMKAYGLEEEKAHRVMVGFMNGDLEELEVTGVDIAGVTKVSNRVNYGSLDIPGTLGFDTASRLSIIAEMSRKIERSMVEAVADIRRRGLKTEFRIKLTLKGLLDEPATSERYKLRPMPRPNYDPNLQQLVRHYHKPTDMTFTFDSSW